MALNLFGQTYQQILDQVLGGGKDGKFQLAYPFIDWTWPTPNSGFIDPTAYTYVGRIPQWSAIGQSYRPTATDLHSAYLSMLLDCPKLTIPPEKQQQLTEADEQITKCLNKTQEDTEARNRAWQIANSDLPPGVPKPEWNEWVVNSGWASTLQGDKDALAKASETKQLIVSQENPQYKDAVAAATPPTVQNLKPGYVLCFVTPGQKEVRPNYLIGQSGSDWIAQLTEGGGMPINIQLSASTSSSALQQSWAQGVMSGEDYQFFSIYSENGWKELDIAKEDKTVRVSIKIAAVTQVPIVPDSEWYKSGYLNILATKSNWNPPFTTDKVFGKGGLIPLVVTGMVAGYQPSFEIKMSRETFQQHKSEFTTCDGIRIGPFQFGGSGRTSSDSWTHSVSSSTFSGKSTAKYPFIMGFLVSEPVTTKV